MGDDQFPSKPSGTLVTIMLNDGEPTVEDILNRSNRIAYYQAKTETDKPGSI